MSEVGSREAPESTAVFLAAFAFLLLLNTLVPGSSPNDTGLLFSPSAFADSALCNSVPDTTFSFSGTALNPDTMKVAIVWIAFSDSNDAAYSPCYKQPTVLGDTLPSWFRELETEFEEFIGWQSYGKLILDAVTVQKSGADSLTAWNLGRTPCYWITSFNDPQIRCPNTTALGAEGCVNRYTIDLIEIAKGDGWMSQFDAVSFIHRGTAFSSDLFCGFGGLYGIRYTGCTGGCAYLGPGNTQRPIAGDSAGDKQSTAWLLGHEFGHTIGLGHTPRSGQDTTGTVFMGRYDAMQNGAPQPIDFDDTFNPYHVWQLTEYAGDDAPKWFESGWFDTITENTLDVRVTDVRDPSARNIVRVDTNIETYDSEFWLVNHQDASFDEFLGGKLLAIWHMRHPEDPLYPRDFDLEVAAGKHEYCGSSVPDAVSGKDSLECRLHQGRVLDLYADSGPDTLGPRSNPNSNDYGSAGYPGIQNVETGISIHDIRLDPVQDPQEDYLVDVIYESDQESPFLYLWQGKNFPRQVNLLAGLGQPAQSQGQYTVGGDCIVLSRPLSFDDNRYTFKMREDGRSTTYLDRLALHVVDHEPNVTIVTTGDRELVGYATETPPDAATGLPGNPLAAVSQRGNPVHGEAGSALVLEWDDLAPESGGIIVSARGRERNNMPQDGTLVIEVPDGQGGWSEVSSIIPRSELTDAFFRDTELGRTGAHLLIRIRWLDYHAVDYVAFVTIADPSTWSAAVVAPDSAEVAYGGSRLSELMDLDGSFAVLGPGGKLTVTFPFSPPVQSRVRSVVFAADGYYVIPEGGGSSAHSGGQSIIDYVDRNRPNPFNLTTHIRFALNRGAPVSLDVYSVEGRLIRRLYHGPLESGAHAFVWDGRTTSGEAVSSGVYFYRLRAGDEVANGRMLTLK